MRSSIVCLFFLMALAGCATNPFKSFYNDRADGMNVLINPAAIITSEEPKLFRGTKLEEDNQKMMEDGYQLLGYSSFNSGNVNAKQATAYGKEIHASVVLFYTQYTNTLSGAMPLTLPDTQTTVVRGMGAAQHSGNIYGSSGRSAMYSGSTVYSGSATATTYGSRTTYIPYNINRYDYLASYWIKMKPPVLGVFFNDLTPEIRKQIGSNKGVIVEVVVKGSPAFSADLLKGDIIKKVNDTEVLDTKFLMDFLPAHAGEKVSFYIIRDGKELSKDIQLNPGYVVQDEKYGNLPNKYLVYINSNANLSKRAQVNLSKIFSSYQKAKDYDKVLGDGQKVYMDGRGKKVNDIKQLQDKMNLMSNNEKKGKKADFEARVNSLKEFDIQQQADLRKDQNEKMKEILRDIEKVIVDFGNKNQYKAIYSNTMPNCNEKDISDEIIALLNGQYK